MKDRGRTDRVLILTCDVQFQSPASRGSEPHTCKRSRPKASRFERQNGNRRTDRRTGLIALPPNVVGNEISYHRWIHLQSGLESDTMHQYAVGWSTKGFYRGETICPLWQFNGRIAMVQPLSECLRGDTGDGSVAVSATSGDRTATLLTRSCYVFCTVHNHSPKSAPLLR